MTSGPFLRRREAPPVIRGLVVSHRDCVNREASKCISSGSLRFSGTFINLTKASCFFSFKIFQFSSPNALSLFTQYCYKINCQRSYKEIKFFYFSAPVNHFPSPKKRVCVNTLFYRVTQQFERCEQIVTEPGNYKRVKHFPIERGLWRVY